MFSVRAAILAACAAIAAPAYAHSLGRSESAVDVRGAEVRVRLILDLLEMNDVDVNHDGSVSTSELDAAIDRVYAAMKAHLAISSGGAAPVRTSLERYAVREGHVGEMNLLFTFPGEVTRLTVRSTLHQLFQPAHEHIVSVSFGEEPTTILLDATRPEATFAPLPRRDFAVSRRVGVEAGAAFVIAAVLYSIARRSRKRMTRA